LTQFNWQVNVTFIGNRVLVGLMKASETMMDTTRAIDVRYHHRPAVAAARSGFVAFLLAVALVVQVAAAAPAVAPGRDPQRKVSPPTRVAPKFSLGDEVRDPFLPSAVLLDPSASSGGNGTAMAGVVAPPVPVKTGPVTVDEVVAIVMVQGVYQVGVQTMATVNGNPVQAGAVLPLMVRGQACSVSVLAVDALAQKVLLKYGEQVFERKLNPSRPSGGGVPTK
jgi:hypothetical protein